MGYRDHALIFTGVLRKLFEMYVNAFIVLSQIKKIHVFRLTQLCLNLLVKPRIFFRFSGKKYNFMHFER